jgi:teichuronic acid biosynthesis glycosyltransferase TuaC
VCGSSPVAPKRKIDKLSPADTETLDILVYTSLFPNAEQPRHGIFIEQRLRHLQASNPVGISVVAPVPWFPLKGQRYGDYGAMARVAATERRNGWLVHHPRYFVLPKLSWRVSPLLMYLTTIEAVRRLHAERRFDLIDAHFFYPDGVAAVMVGKALEIPVVITARGNDISLMPRYLMPRKFITWAASNASAMVTVCAALKEALIDLGADGRRIEVFRNGVDLERFQPSNGANVRRRLNIGGRKLLLSVGHLIERKGNHLTIEALQSLPDCVLALVGDGPEEKALRKLAQRYGVADRVRFVPPVPQNELKAFYSAADALVLASSREGWANVLLESMACGSPVVATSVWGTPEVVGSSAAGVLIDERSALGVADGINRLLANPPPRDSTRRYAESFSWADTSRGQYELFRRILARRRAD